VLVALAITPSACASSNGPGAPAEEKVGRAGSRLPRLLPPSTGQTYFVSRTGSNANPGTMERPWLTVQKALDTLAPGERALVRGGTYQEDLRMSRAGRPDAPITVSAFARERVVLRPASHSGDTYAIEITGSHFRLRGFVLEGARGTSSTNVYFERSAHHVELSRNEIRYSQDQGIFAEATTRNLHILGNRIHDNGLRRVLGQHQSHGIYIEGRDHLIANNVIFNHRHGFGIQVYPENRGSVIVHNTVVGSGHSAIVVGGRGGVTNISIRNNILAFNARYGVQMDSDCPNGPIQIDRNVIYGNGSGAIESGCAHVRAYSSNVFANPQFVSHAERVFQVVGRSPAVDRARRDFSPAVDILGRRRPLGRGYDIGAFERGR
jgi:pectate disaccharide-lyase